MSELFSPAPLRTDLEGVRIRLEGRLERLEQAMLHYGHLQGLLRGRWQRKAIDRRAELDAAIAQEAALDEAVEHLRRLGQREGWAADAEPLAVLRRFEAARELLRTQLIKRLASITPLPAQTALLPALEKLRALAVTIRMPGPHEVVLLEGTATRSMPVWLLVLSFLILPAAPALLWTFYGLFAAGTMLLATLILAVALLPLGKYLVLANRLIWLPRRGAPFELPLANLPADGVKLRRHATGLQIEGPLRLELPVTTAPVELATLLLLGRDGPLKGIDKPPSGTVVILPASVPRPGPDLTGFALLHSAGIGFLPRGSAPDVLKTVARTRTDVPVSEEYLLKQLTRLPADALAATLRDCAQAGKAFYWDASEVRPDPGGVPSQLLRLRTGLGTTEGRIEIPLKGVDAEALRTLFPWTQDQSRQVP